MSVNLTVVIDNDEAIKKFKELQKVAKSTTSNIVTDSERMDMAMRKLGSALGALGISFSLTEFARQVATVRGEFQKLEVAFTTMLGSKAEADALMQETVKLAATTPFDLTGVANGAKQLLAYGSTAQDVGNEIKMLGNIAAGMSLPLSDLVYLYGTTRTQGRLFTRDLMQFTGRGIPLMEELAKQFGVAKSEVSKLVTEGKVGFAEVEKALKSMTSEGGKFYNLMEEQSKTISGRMSNLGDSIQQMFNEIGKQTEGAIYKAIDAASLLVDNYEKVGKVLIDIVAAYGSYKAAVMLVNAVSKVRTAYLAAEALALRANALAHKELTVSTIALSKAIKASNIAKLANPYVLAGVAISGLIFGIYKLITAKSAEEKAIDSVNAKIAESNKLIEEEQDKASQAASALISANSSALERAKAYNTLISIYPSLLDKYDEEKIKLLSLAELNKEIALATEQRKMASLTAQKEEIQSTINSIKAIENSGGQISAAQETLLKTLYASLDDVNSKIAEQLRLMEQVNFESLSNEEKIAAYEAEIEAIDDLLASLDELRKAESGDDILSQRAELVRKRDTLKSAGKDKNPDDEAATKEIINKRKQAQKEAYEAEKELRRSQIKDKIELLEFDKNEELKAIDEKIAATTDAVLKGLYQQQRAYREELWNNRIAEETFIPKMEGSVASQFTLGQKVSVDAILPEPKMVKERTITIQDLFGDMRKMTAKEMNAIADDIEKTMSNYDDPKVLEVMREAIDKLRASADEVESPLLKLRDGIKNLFEAKKGSKEFFDAIDDISAGLESVIDVASGLDSVLESLGAGKAMDSAIDSLNAANDAVKAFGKGAQLGSAFGAVGAVIGGVVGAVGSLVKSISQIHDKRKEQNIQRLQEQIEDLEYSYDRLGVAVSKAYSTDANKLIEEQIRLLEKQKQLVEEQIQEEDEKKNSDNKRIDDYKKKIDEINDAIEESEERAKTALMGVSFDEFRDSFLDTLSDMSSSAEDFADNFEEVLKKAILNALIVEKYEQRIRNLRDATTSAMDDRKLSDEEKAALKAEHDAIVNDMLEDRKALAEIYGWSDDSGGGSSSTGKGFQAMSQETGSELNGRFTDIQGKVTEIRSFVMDLMTTGKMQYNETVNIRDIMIQLNGNVADIKSYAKVLPEMRDSINQMSKKLDNL